MNFYQVRLLQQAEDFRPLARDVRFQLRTQQIPRSDPHHFRRRTLDSQAIEEISILRHEDAIMRPSVTPKVQIGHPGAEFPRMDRFPAQRANERLREILIDEQLRHEARRMVE